MWILWTVLSAIALLLCVVLLRAFTFTPKNKSYTDSGDEVTFDADAAVAALQQLVRCKTISYFDRSLEDDAEFEKLVELLPSLYPEVYRVCSLERLPDRALLFHWKGKASDAPCVMMSHYDVVPVEEESWQRPAFEGIIEDGVLWGRGTLDTKITFSSVLFAANTLIGQGFVPEQDMYFAFSGCEEINGDGALHIVNYFKEKSIVPALVLDEGGAVVENVFPSVKTPCAMIGIAEKGMMNVTLSVESNGGHASAPKPHTPIGQLSAACCKMEQHPFPFHLTPPVAGLFDTLARHSSFVYRIIFANLWLFRGVLDMICKSGGGEMNAMVRTTVAFTQASGSSAPNVIPPSASMTANLRLNPMDTVESATAYIRKTIEDDSIVLTVKNGTDPTPISQVDCEAFDKIAASVAATWQGCLVSPYLMVQCSDSRHYRDLSDHVYRFSAMDLTGEERKTIHGHNERIRLDCIARATEFYIRLMRQC